MQTLDYVLGLHNCLEFSQPQLTTVPTNDSTLLSYPNIKPKATLGERAFVFAAPKLWNALPRLIRESTSIGTFKGKVKTIS